MEGTRTAPRAGDLGPDPRALRLLKDGPGDEAEVLLLTREETEEEEQRTPLLCRACGNEITAAEYGVHRHGRFEHTFRNPAGYVFRLGCFSTAWNCLLHGVPTYEHTWFPGFRWRFCSCGRCALHLGWQYDSGAESFFGLILDNLVRQGSPH